MKTTIAYRIMDSTYVFILLILLGQTIANAPANSEASTAMLWLAGLGLWLFKILPFLILIPGLLQKRHRTATWLSFMSMFYFVLAVLLAFTPGGSLWGWLLSISTLVLFFSSMLYTRWKKAEPLTHS